MFPRFQQGINQVASNAPVVYFCFPMDHHLFKMEASSLDYCDWDEAFWIANQVDMELRL